MRRCFKKFLRRAVRIYVSACQHRFQWVCGFPLPWFVCCSWFGIGNKDDFPVSGVNDSCVTHNRADLHLIDTFCAMVKLFFGQCEAAGIDTELRAKTYDLTSAYRHVPVRPSHYRCAYVSVYNCKKGCAEIYRMRTMPFGATQCILFSSLGKVSLFFSCQGTSSSYHQLL